MCDISVEDADGFSFYGFGGIVAEMGVDSVDGAADLPLKTDGVGILMLPEPREALFPTQGGEIGESPEKIV